jgi:hypothetical protein
MKKLAVVLGLLGIVLLFSGPQLGSGQLEGAAPQQQKPIDRELLQKEIEILRLFGEMGLSRDQLMQLKEIVSELRAAQEAITQAQLELREFLVGFQGSREELIEDVKPFDEEVAQAREAFRERLQASVEQIKDLLTLRQGEILRQFLCKHALKERLPKRPWWEDPPHRIRIPEDIGEFEIHIEVRKRPHKRVLFESFEERIREWLKRHGLALIPETFKLQPWEDRRALKRGEFEDFPGPRLLLRKLRGMWLIDRQLLERFLVRNIELLERLLTEKLERLGTTAI